MPKTLRPLSLLAALAAVILVIAGCGGNDVPSDSVATVGDAKITKQQYTHWLIATVKQQAQSSGQKPTDVVVPDPPDFTKCVAAKAKQPAQKGAPKPDPKTLKTQCKQEYDSANQTTMQFLISSQWLLQETAKRKIVASDKEVRTTFDQQKKQSFPKEADYQKFLTSSGQTEADLLFRIKQTVLINKLQQAIIKEQGTVTDKQIQDYYNKNKQRFAQPETRDLQVVLAKTQAKANAAKKAIQSGTPWAKVAKKFSQDDASKSQGGKLPGVTKGQQEKTFDAAIFSASTNKLLGPIKTQFGFYVFRVTKITPAKQQSLDQVKTTIKSLLQSQGQQKALNDFVKDYQDRYTKMTDCAKGYVVSQCNNAPKPKTNTAPVSGGSPQTGGAPPQTGAPPGVPQQVPQQGAPPQGAPPQGAPPQQGGAPPQPVPAQPTPSGP
jgi:foldase protein PrsA